MTTSDFLNRTKMNFAKNFFQRSFNGKVMTQLQALGYKGTSDRGAWCFIHIIPNEEEYQKDKNIYITALAQNLLKEMEQTYESRTIKYSPIKFCMPAIPLVETMTVEPLSNFFPKQVCLDLFNYVYDKRHDCYASIDDIFKNFPHVTEEFLGQNNRENRMILKGSREDA